MNKKIGILVFIVSIALILYGLVSMSSGDYRYKQVNRQFSNCVYELPDNMPNDTDIQLEILDMKCGQYQDEMSRISEEPWKYIYSGIAISILFFGWVASSNYLARKKR